MSQLIPNEYTEAIARAKRENLPCHFFSEYGKAFTAYPSGDIKDGHNVLSTVRKIEKNEQLVSFDSPEGREWLRKEGLSK